MMEERSRPYQAGPDSVPAAKVPAAGDVEWRERLAAQLAEHRRRRERRQAERAALAEARRHGLAQRHRRKLARTREGGGRR